MTRRRLRPPVAALAVGALVVLAAGSSHAGSGEDAATLLEQARDAAGTKSFAGVVEVRWRDGAGQHVATVGARSIGGAFVVGRGDDRVVGHDHERWSGDAGAPTAWSDVTVEDLPAVDSAWDVDVVGSRRIAGRAATLVVARDEDDQVRARFAIEPDSGQLLQREVLDRDGVLVRSVTFVRLVDEGVAPAVPAPPSTPVAAPTVMDDVPGGYAAPDDVGTGYVLVGRYRHADGLVQLYYDDGLFSVSLFQQRGRLDWATLPAGGAARRVDGVRTRSYATPEGHVTVWADGGLVLTTVADGPPEVGADFVRAASGTHDGGLVDDVVDFVLGPFGWE